MPARMLMSAGLALALGLTLGLPAEAKDTVVDPALMTQINPDGDGTVDLSEAKAAGARMFKKLNPDGDGTLDAKELSGRVSEEELKAADPDDDGTLDEAEYMALIEKLFAEANPDDDGTLDEAELKSPAGQKLLALIAD